MSRNASVGRYATITRQVTLDFPNILAATSATLQTTAAALGIPDGVIGAGAVVAVSPVGDLEPGLAVYARAEANAVNVTVVNATAGAVDPASRVFSLGISPLNSGI